MGIALEIGRERLDSLLELLERRGWTRPKAGEYSVMEKLVDDKWVWSGSYVEEGGYYIFRSAVNEEGAEDYSSLHRRGVRELEREVTEVAYTLGLRIISGRALE